LLGMDLRRRDAKDHHHRQDDESGPGNHRG
jgi:hypothetical protein